MWLKLLHEKSKQKCIWPAQCLTSLIPYQGNIHRVSRASCERSDAVSKNVFLEEITVTQHFKPSKPFCLSFLFSSVDDSQFMMDMWWMSPARVEMDCLSLFYQCSRSEGWSHQLWIPSFMPPCFILTLSKWNAQSKCFCSGGAFWVCWRLRWKCLIQCLHYFFFFFLTTILKVTVCNYIFTVWG